MDLIVNLIAQGAQMMLVLALAPLLTGFVRKVKEAVTVPVIVSVRVVPGGILPTVHTPVVLL